jgi:hypothetical protein
MPHLPHLSENPLELQMVEAPAVDPPDRRQDPEAPADWSQDDGIHRLEGILIDQSRDSVAPHDKAPGAPPQVDDKGPPQVDEGKSWQLEGATFFFEFCDVKTWVSGSRCGKFFLHGQQSASKRGGLRRIKQYPVQNVTAIDVTEGVITESCWVRLARSLKSPWGYGLLKFLLALIMLFAAYGLLPKTRGLSNHYDMTRPPSEGDWSALTNDTFLLLALLAAESGFRCRMLFLYHKHCFLTIWVGCKTFWYLVFFAVLIGARHHQIDCSTILPGDDAPARVLNPAPPTPAPHVGAPMMCGIDIGCTQTEEMFCTRYEVPEVDTEIPTCTMVQRGLCSKDQSHSSSHGTVLFFIFGSWIGLALVLFDFFLLTKLWRGGIVPLLASCGIMDEPREPKLDRAQTHPPIWLLEFMGVVPTEEVVLRKAKVNTYTVFMTIGKAIRFTLRGEDPPSEVLQSIFHTSSS